jgi:DNA-nicking Smr family endonuclease
MPRETALHVTPRPIKPASVLDLHGMTLAQAHSAFLVFVREAVNHHQSTIIVTGRSGQIRKEFPQWAALHSRVHVCSMMPNQGSFKVTLR